MTASLMVCPLICLNSTQNTYYSDVLIQNEITKTRKIKIKTRREKSFENVLCLTTIIALCCVCSRIEKHLDGLLIVLFKKRRLCLSTQFTGSLIALFAHASTSANVPKCFKDLQVLSFVRNFGNSAALPK